MTFNSNYSDLIKDYITFKQSLGYAMSNQYHWRDIDRFLLASGEQGSELGITENQFHTWYKKRPNETPRNQYDRACRLRNFVGVGRIFAKVGRQRICQLEPHK